MVTDLQWVPAFLFYARDWLTGEGTRLMTPEQKGAFIDLLAHSWMSTPPCTLPDDDTALARLSGLHAKWRKVGALVRAQFKATDDGRLRNAKLWAVYQEMQEYRRSRSEAGKAGARGRWPGKAAGVRPHSASNGNGPANDMAEGMANVWPASALASASAVAEEKPESVLPSSTELVKANGDAELAMEAGWLVERYRQLYPKYRNGACYHGKPTLDFTTALDLVRTWPSRERMEKLIVVFLTTDHEFAKKGSRTIGQFSALASWCDSQLREHGL